uniref:Pleiotropic drug resistance protein 3 n=1 Tax=Aegilops tauschii TaxID=37682 RepID=R7W6R7_AEGTA
MEGLARETNPSSHHQDFTACASDERPDESELELASRQRQNGAANTEHVSENMLLDSSKLGALKRREFFDNLLKNLEDDHLRFLRGQKERIDRHVFFFRTLVDVKLPAIEVRYNNLFVEAECRVTKGNHLPSLWNSTKGAFSGLVKLLGFETERAKTNVLEDVSGIIKPCRLTLLLGPPGCGKSTLLRALAGKLDKSLKTKYFQRKLFSDQLLINTPSVPKYKVTGDISYNGYELHEFVPEKTAVYINQHDLHIAEMTVRETLDFSAQCQGVGRRPKILKEVNTRESVAGIIPDADIDLYMKIMGLEICADTMVGDAMRRGISGGQKKRLTTAEMIVGPASAYFMDEISNGLDSSTTFQIINCFQQLTNISEYTMVISLLQPTPEVFDLFDDLILMAEGKIIYHGPRNEALNFFEECGFICPERKAAADFLQEILSWKDQQQYWLGPHESYRYISPHELSSMFRENHRGRKLHEQSVPPKSQLGKEALAFNKYSLQKLEMFKACGAREALLMKRNMFVYVFKTGQVKLHSEALFPVQKMSMQIGRLPSFYKQKSYYFYSSWAYAIPASVLKVPISILDSLVWISITYYGIGYTPTVSRFFCQFLILCLLHHSVTSQYRFIASYFQTPIVSFFYLFLALTVFLTFGGFILPKTSMPGWLNWGFWISPMTYAEISIVINEFLAPRWQKESIQNITIGNQILVNHGLYYSWHYYWISFGALLGSILLFYIAFGLALDYRTPTEEYHGSRPTKSLCQQQEKDYTIQNESDDQSNISKAKVTIPVMHLPITFHNLNYYIDTPPEMLKQGYPTRRLRLLNNITGALRPGVLSALMGVSGAGKTTLLDVLAGRKTGGYIEGDIRIGGYPKKFVAEVLETVELDQIKDVLVGSPQKNGLSMEQRKRLTIAVELVSNPSIILMDEPTTGLDTRSAAIVIRAVKNICETGRTVVCTIHQPSTEIFEAFDEKISGVPKIKSNCNPATWMMDVTSTSMEVQHNMDFAILYEESSLHSFAQNGWIQLKACLWKQNITYWRSPQYNLRRIMMTVISALIYGILFWKHAKVLNNEQDMLSVFGAMYLGFTTIGAYNDQTIIPFSTTERIVMYRERFAGMYSSWSYSFAQAFIEIPYVFIQVVLYTLIVYPSTGLIGHYGLYFIPEFMFVQKSPIVLHLGYPYRHPINAFCLTKQIPKWWTWLYYLTPTSWALNALLTSQYGNIEKEVKAFGETKSVSIFLNDYFGFHQDKLSVVAAVLVAFPFVLIILFSLSIEKLNFQKRYSYLPFFQLRNAESELIGWLFFSNLMGKPHE